MEAVVLVIHLLLALALVGLVLIQRSEGGGLGIGGGSGGLGGLATPGGTASLLTRATAFCAAAFFCTSLALGILAGQAGAERRVLTQALEAQAAAAVEAQAEPDAAAEPALPAVPVE
jgi:preprotein translocase subunit SecG